MKKLALLLLVSFAFIFAEAQNHYKEPWKNKEFPIIIDPYSENPVNFDSLITDKRVCAIIHKATQGYSADKEYTHREYLAKQKGLLWGSYHMGMKGDPVKQADFYLNSAGIDSTELMALDLEGLDSNYFMSLKNAERFINRIHEKTNRYPLLYCNNEVLEEISKNYNDTSIFSKCGLWYSRFQKQLPVFNRSVWKNYTLWQFSSEVNCKETGKCWYNVPGTLYDMDVNIYNGQIWQLKRDWPNITVKWDPVEEGKYFLSHWDFDGDMFDDTVSFDYSGGAHCCYKIHIHLSSDKKDHTFPFEMDGGYIYGVDDSNPTFFHIGDIDPENVNGLPQIAMTIQTYNGKPDPIPKKWQKEFGIRTNRILIGYDQKSKSLKARDWKGEPLTNY